MLCFDFTIYRKENKDVIFKFVVYSLFFCILLLNMRLFKKRIKKDIDIKMHLLYNHRVLKRINPRKSGGREYIMSQVKVKENESLDSALRRFKRQTSRDGVIQEVRKREHYEKPSVKRKKKSEAARKRKFK